MTFQFPGFQHRLHLDYETRSACNIKTAGSHKYARDPSTKALMLGWAVDDEPEELWLPAEESMPERLRAFLMHPGTAKTAFNATFERQITQHVIGIDIPAEQWRCTMVASYYLAFAGGLDQILEAIGLQKKDARGQRLINLFCTPAPKNHKVEWYDRYNRPAEWEEFKEYCRQDVRVERQLMLWLSQFPMMHEWDWARYCLDQKINDHGVPMSIEMARGAVQMWDAEKELLTAKLQQATALPKVTRGPFAQWLADQGCDLPDLTKETLSATRAAEATSPAVREALTLWMQKEAKATSKYTAAINGTDTDGRARGMFQFKGASRTDRTSGRRIQLQNLKRTDTKPEGIPAVVGAVKSANPTLLHMITGKPVSDALGGAIRHVIQAPPGKTLVVNDLTSIESVVLGWIAMCPSIDETFRAGRDSYRMFAMNYFGIEYDQVTKQQRSFAKPPVLGCGFMLGWKGLIAYSTGYGVDMTEEQARNAVATFRGMYPEIPAFWKWIYDAAKYVITTGQPISGYRLHLERDSDFLRIWLPSGRALSYFRPEVKKKAAPWAEVTLTLIAQQQGWSAHEDLMKATGSSLLELEQMGYVIVNKYLDNVCYMGQNDKNQWTRIYAHAGLFTENIVQSIAMDILFNGITNADAAGLSPVLQVHDEIGCEEDKQGAEAKLELLGQCMTTQPDWCRDMWLGADGYICDYYTKD